MTKLIAVLIVAAVLFGFWELFLYWEKVKNQEQDVRKQEAASVIVPEQLPGMPQPQQQMEASLRAAQAQGATGLKNWLKANGRNIQDPRKAWIELDYCLLVYQKDPSEAKRVFAEVKGRTRSNSSVYPRVKQMEKTYE